MGPVAALVRPDSLPRIVEVDMTEPLFCLLGFAVWTTWFS